MRSVRFEAIAVVAISGIVATVACNAINGSGDLSVTDDAGEAPLPPRVVTSEDGATTVEAGPIATGTCTCAPAPPAGWKGPMALATATGSPPACDVGLVTEYKGGLVPATPPGCTPCTCGAPSGGAHCDTTISFWNSSNCAAGTKCGEVTLSGTACSPVTFCAGTAFDSAMKTALTPVGSCGAASGGAKTAAAFESEATACMLASPPMNACESGSACAPTPGAGTKTCIEQAGDVACPPGPYTQKTVFHAALDDTRTCSACTCNPACAGGLTRVYNDGTCATSLDSTGPNACDSLPTNVINGSSKVGTVPTFSCAASGGAVSGAVTGKEPTTFCCLP